VQGWLTNDSGIPISPPYQGYKPPARFPGDEETVSKVIILSPVR
jgi:hypothetical protein